MAERFAEHGAKVMLVGRRQEKLDAAAKTIQQSGGFAATAALDVRDYEKVAEALRKTKDELGPIDVLLCAAAGNFPAPVTGMSANGFKAVIDCIKAFSETDFTEDLKKIDVPTMIVHGDDDQIVPIDAAGRASAKIVKGSVLKVYAGAPHGLMVTHKEQLHADLLAFVKG